MSDPAKVALAALNAGAEWDRDTVVPGAAARALRDHVASLEVSRLLDVRDVKLLCGIAADVSGLTRDGVPELRAYLRSRYGSAMLAEVERAAARLHEAQARAEGE